MDKGWYETELIGNLETMIDVYEQDREQFWKSQESDVLGDSDTAFDQAERFAEAIRKNTEQLLPVQKIDYDLSNLCGEYDKLIERGALEGDGLQWLRNPEAVKNIEDIIVNSGLSKDEKSDSIRKWLDKYCCDHPESKESPLRLVWERLIIDMCWRGINRTKVEEGVSRRFKLFSLILTSSPSKTTREFLSKLSNCFVWGFDNECIILCRSVIDAAFNDAVDNDVCEKHFGERPNSFTLSDRIHAAVKEGIIDESTKKLAMTIKGRGDLAVHCRPGITKDVFGAIRDTLTVIEQLQKKRRKL